MELAVKRSSLRESVERDQYELELALGELRERVKRSVRLGFLASLAPWQWLAGGFVFGLWFGIGRRRLR